MKKSTIILSVSFVFIFALGIYLGQVFFGSGQTAPVISSNASSSNPTAALPNVTKPNAIDSAPPPWATSSTNGAANGTSNGAGNGMASGTLPSGVRTPAQRQLDVAAREKELQDMQQFQRELQQATVNGKPDPKKMIEVFERLKQNRGSVIGGVNVDVMINNLEKAQQMQDLSAEIQKEANKGGAQDPKKMQDYMDRLRKLQGQLRTDVMVAPASMPQALPKK
jgi:hypothetical protein